MFVWGLLCLRLKVWWTRAWGAVRRTKSGEHSERSGKSFCEPEAFKTACGIECSKIVIWHHETRNTCRRRQKGKGRGTSRTLYWDKHRMIPGVLVTLFFDDCGKSLFSEFIGPLSWIGDAAPARAPTWPLMAGHAGVKAMKVKQMREDQSRSCATSIRCRARKKISIMS